MKAGDTVEMVISHQGAMRPGSAWVKAISEDLAAVTIDMHSKRGEADGTSSSESDGEPTPGLIFWAGENGLHLDESQPKDAPTIVVFPQFKGWRVFAIDGPMRYTVHVVLTKEPK